MWMRFKATYTVWPGSKSYPATKTFESVENSLSAFSERMEREAEAAGDTIQTVNIENLGAE